jgi:hypothetical protein
MPTITIADILSLLLAGLYAYVIFLAIRKIIKYLKK